MGKALASKTAEVKFLQKGEPGDKGARLRIRDWVTGQDCLCGDAKEAWYDVTLYKSLLYLCVKSHTSSTTNNPQTSVANNLGYWEKAQDWVFVATKLLLAERIKAEDIDADNLVAKNVDVEGTIRATAAFIKIHGFHSTEGYFYLNPSFGSDFNNGRPNRISQGVYMLPDAAQWVGMKISLIIYNGTMASTFGSISVVTTNAFNDYEIVGSEFHYCNRASISAPGVYEFISLGNMWILANNNASYSYADLGNHTYEDPIN